MPNKQSEKMLRELELRAKEFGEKSTKLSNMLEEAEAFLQRMPGKLEVRVNDLSFERVQGEWRLWVGNDVDGEPVTASSVDKKAYAARTLPELVEKLFSRVTRRLEQVDAGLEALSNVPFLSEEDQQ